MSISPIFGFVIVLILVVFLVALFWAQDEMMR
jgi:hypothetical protein